MHVATPLYISKSNSPLRYLPAAGKGAEKSGNTVSIDGVRRSLTRRENIEDVSRNLVDAEEEDDEAPISGLWGGRKVFVGGGGVV